MPAVDYAWAEPPQVVLVHQLLDYLADWSSIRDKVCILSYEEGVMVVNLECFFSSQRRPDCDSPSSTAPRVCIS